MGPLSFLLPADTPERKKKTDTIGGEVAKGKGFCIGTGGGLLAALFI